METIEIKIQEQKNDVCFTIVRHQKNSSEREKIFCDGWVKLVESIILGLIPKIDLKHAIIAWSSNTDAEDGIRRLKVFKILDQIIPKEYICTDGACFSYWQISPYPQQVKRLQAIGTKLINEYGFTSEEVNDAFLSITEYFETQKTTGLKGFNPYF